MYVSEIYQSRQGEGLLTGTESIFVRTSGCNLRCWFCDTPYTSWNPEGQQISLDDIESQISLLDADHVVITGGEPMIARKMSKLCQRIRELKKHITIETAGTSYQSLACDLMSISPKLANSTPSLERAGKWHQQHEATRHQPDIVSRLMSDYPYQLKFVVDKPEDLSEIDAYLLEFPNVDRSRILLMPQGVEAAELREKSSWIESSCQESGFQLCPRKHIEWYGNQRGT